MARFRVGVQLHPQHTSVEDLRAGWRAADDLGVDSIWLWDHFFPISGDPDGAHFEAYSLLSAMAVETARARIGVLVTCNSYRNPDLLADMARTVDHLSGGRLILGLGAGWFERDYAEYGYDFGTPVSRLAALEEALPRIFARLGQLNPPPVQSPLPLLIGGGGERRTLRLVAEHAHMWNSFGPPETYAHKNAILDDWCARVGRHPGEVERTLTVREHELDQVGDFLAAGATHLILSTGHPFDLSPVRRLLDVSRG